MYQSVQQSFWWYGILILLFLLPKADVEERMVVYQDGFGNPMVECQEGQHGGANRKLMSI